MSQNNGPSDETLQALAANLPQMAKLVANGKLTGKGKEAPRVAMRPTKACIVCRALFAPKFSVKPIEDDLCRDCREKLEEGFTACCEDKKGVHRIAFVRFPHDPAARGKIILVTESQMDLIQSKYAASTPAQPS